MWLILLQFFLLTGLWSIDIGASIMNMESAGLMSEATGLFGIRDGNTQYHLGLMVVYVVFIVQLAWLLFMIINQKRRANKIIVQRVVDARR